MTTVPTSFSWNQFDGIPDLRGAVLLMWNGFERRSTKLLRTVRTFELKAVKCLRFGDNEFDLTHNDKEIADSVQSKILERIDLHRKDQFQIYQTLFDVINKFDRSTKFVFDITCFPRDILLIIIFLFWKTERISNLSCVYNIASNYSLAEHDVKDKWLSKGVSAVSPVIGFRGVIRPERKMQLVALVGFDDHRVLQIADILSPDAVVFAYGTSKLPGRDWLEWHGADVTNTFLSRFSETIQRTFICEEGQSVFELIDGMISTKPDYNHVIIPMNNKISTLFAGTYCLRNRSVQICYGGALVYNHSNYSEESEIFYYWTPVFSDRSLRSHPGGS
jgi:hypothetical protein